MQALRLALLLVTLAASGHQPLPAAHGAQAAVPDVSAYAGTGAWIDRYDFGHLGDPDVAAAEMAAHGVRTLYLETASWKVSRRRDFVDPAATAALIEAVHATDIRVVAWYLPGLSDRALDMRRIRAALAFTTPAGQHFDSFALDIEATLVNPLAKRNLALLRLSRAVRAAAGPSYPLGAIVPDQRSTSSGNGLWPAFPYAALGRIYDVFLPMAYSSFGRADDAAGVYRYTRANVRYVRSATGRPVHVIGGLTGALSGSEELAVARAARAAGALGMSLYKYTSYNSGSWLALAAFRY